MAQVTKPQIEVNDQEETILSTHARAAQLAEAVEEAKSQVAARSRRQRTWLLAAAVLALVAGILFWL